MAVVLVAADLVGRLAAELHHMKRVERDRAFGSRGARIAFS